MLKPQKMVPFRAKRLSLFITLLSILAMAGGIIFLIVNQGEGFLPVSLVFAVAALVPFFASFEGRRPQARELVPIAVLSASAVVGRLVFLAIPSFQAATAIIIITGLAFGPQSGFITGALTALVSNIFAGQGLHTPWQMLAWGLCGCVAGLLRAPLLKNRLMLLAYGVVCGFVYGQFTNLMVIFGYTDRSLTAALLAMAASLPMDAVHAFANLLFLLLLAPSLLKVLSRVKKKYALFGEGGQPRGDSTQIKPASQ